MTTFTEWYRHYKQYLSGLAPMEKSRCTARIFNLLSEVRVATARKEFVTNLIAAFDTLIFDGIDDASAAAASFEAAISEFALSGQLELQLPTTSPNIPVSHYATARSVLQFGGLGDFDADDPPRRIPVPDGLLYENSGKRLLWITPDPVSNDPDGAAQSLGLPHFAGHFVFEFTIDGVSLRAFVPTCFDAALYEAWMISPPSEHLVNGRTRHTETGVPAHREFVAVVAETQGRFGPGQTLPRGRAAFRVAAMNADYMLGR